MPHAPRLACAATVLALALAACNGPLSKRAADLARDWSKVIRANQVIPVYPMTEDLEPGDVFLVDAPVDEQARRYDEDGYLPLDQHLVRLPAPAYDAFYRPGHGARRDPAEAPAPGDRSGAGPGARTGGSPAPVPAPMAAFPSYSFTVDRGGGLDLGLPVSGVPLALGLMGADRAEASVTINDAVTYGVGTVELWDAVRRWAGDPLVRAKLEHLHAQNVGADADGPPRLFLRVVSRVYLTGGVSITVNRASAGGLDARGGAERDAELPAALAADPDAATAYRRGLETLSTSLTDTLPGGAIRLGYASRSSVALQEEFPRPLVIGYLGFDLPVLAGGRLGAPVATRQVLLRRVAPPTTMATPSDDQRQFDLRRIELEQLAERDPAQAARICLDAAATLSALPTADTAFAAMVRAPRDPDADPVGALAVEQFLIAAERHVARSGDRGLGYKEVIGALDAAHEATGPDALDP